MRDFFPGHFIISVQPSSGMSTKKGANSRVLNKEILITNISPKVNPLNEDAQLTLALGNGVAESASLYKTKNKFFVL